MSHFCCFFCPLLLPRAPDKMLKFLKWCPHGIPNKLSTFPNLVSFSSPHLYSSRYPPTPEYCHLYIFTHAQRSLQRMAHHHHQLFHQVETRAQIKLILLTVFCACISGSFCPGHTVFEVQKILISSGAKTLAGYPQYKPNARTSYLLNNYFLTETVSASTKTFSVNKLLFAECTPKKGVGKIEFL